ncbi:MAG: LamG domain-containing protein [Pirellulaceae bacterium]
MISTPCRRPYFALLFTCVASAILLLAARPGRSGTFEGKFFRGEGNEEYLQLLDISRRMLEPDPEFQNLSMLYTPVWNGFVEGPTWGAWWIQNSYGPTYCALPLLQEPWSTFLQNSQDLWFDQMGDGQRVGGNNWVAPDGCLCDAASPGWIYYKQGDGRTDIHDWGVEFTAAGLLMQCELLLISRDQEALEHYLPLLERCAAFIESRRDPRMNLFRAGPAGNLLAPSYAGYRRDDGSYEQAFLVGLSVTYIAALDRLIELEELAGNAQKKQLYTDQRDRAREGLSHVTTEEGYLLKSLDPNGTRHGVFGAAEHGYLEAVCNHDAICFGVVPDGQARRILDKMCSIPGLRPHDLIITNYPSLDDMYVPADTWLWQFGTWVNGGHWTTCEARMIMAYYRLGYFEDAARSMQQILKFARAFRLDNPLVDFGNAVYQPNEPINLCYDSLGAPAAMVRGLFEYVYRAEGLTLIPHIPPGITRLQQDFPVRLGSKRLYLATVGSGPITAVTLNGQPWSRFDPHTVDLVYDELPDESVIVMALGSAAPVVLAPRRAGSELPAEVTPPSDEVLAGLFPTIAQNDLPLRIGADSEGNNRFIGQLARARLFRRALTVDEVATLARREASGLDRDADLVADWQFGHRIGDLVPNVLGDHLAAKIVGEAEVVDGSAGEVLQLRGNGYLEVAPDPRLHLDRACTLEAWLRCETLPATGARILDKSRVGTSNGYLLDTLPGNSLRLIVAQGTLAHDAKLPTDSWSHVAATVDPSGRLALFVNGQQVATAQPESPVALHNIRVARLRRIHQRLVAAGLDESYEAYHLRLVLACYAVAWQRQQLLADGRLTRLEPASQVAADMSYLATPARLYEGLEKTIAAYATSEDERCRQIHLLFTEETTEEATEEEG